MGGEISVNYSRGYWIKNAGVSYSFCHLEKEQIGTELSKYALDYLKHKVSVGLEHGLYKGFGARRQLVYQQREGAYTDLLGNVVNYTPFALFDGRLFWENQQLNIFLEANNIFNTHYYDYGGIEQPGIWIKTGISVKLNLR